MWRTDRDGRFSFWAPIESTQRLVTDADGYDPVSLLIHTGALHDIQLTPSSSVQFTASTGKPQLMPPSPAVAPAILSEDSGPKMSGSGKDWSPWYRLGVGKAPGGYRLHHVEFWLSGDRTCGKGAECREVIKNDEQVTWKFRLQGHNEEGAPPQTYSVAHLRVLYRAQ